jgi:hypothetical protein
MAQIFVTTQGTVLYVRERGSREKEHTFTSNFSEDYRSIGINPNGAQYKVSDKSFKDAKELKFRGYDSDDIDDEYRLAYYGGTKHRIELCGSGLKQYFKEVPKVLYYKEVSNG